MRLPAVSFAISVAISAVLACGAPPSPRPVAVVPPTPVASAERSPELSPALLPLAWWLGDWDGEEGTQHWLAAGGAIYGIALRKDGDFEVMIIDDGDGPGKPDGVLRFLAMPSAMRMVEFRQRELGDRTVTFANDAHDFPKTVRFRRNGPELEALLAADGQSMGFNLRPIKSPRAPELEAADRAFSADTVARGVVGWVAAFDAHGAMMRKPGRIEGAEAITQAMQKLLSTGKLAWAPIASARARELGFTVGKATYTGATPADSWRSTYVTIWRHQPDGSWKVLFDVGRAIQD
jgi:ketosteroid isomerase-like protein